VGHPPHISLNLGDDRLAFSRILEDVPRIRLGMVLENHGSQFIQPINSYFWNAIDFIAISVEYRVW
jgi:hypothetical protein